MASLIDILGEIPDPRRGNAQRHALLDILAIALVASICGAESCVDFAEFAEDREPLLREFLSLENGLPSHDTFSRVFRLLDPEAFAPLMPLSKDLPSWSRTARSAYLGRVGPHQRQGPL